MEVFVAPSDADAVIASAQKFGARIPRALAPAPPLACAVPWAAGAAEASGERRRRPDPVV